MAQERDILDTDKILEVLDEGRTIWKKTDPNNSYRVTFKLLHKNRVYLFYRDGSTHWMKELLDDLPEELRNKLKYED